MAVLDPNSVALHSTHGILGIFLLIGIILQIGLGIKSSYVKCDELKSESTFEIGHSNLAMFVVGGAIVNIYIGFDLLNNDVSVIGGYTAWLLILVIFVAYLERKRGRASRYISGSLFKNQQRGLGFPVEKPKVIKDSKSPFMYRPSWNKQGGKNDSLIAETLVRSRNSSIGPRPGVKVISGGPPVPRSRQGSTVMSEKAPPSPAMLSERISVLDKLTQKLLDSRKPSTSNVLNPPEGVTGVQSPGSPTPLQSRSSSPVHEMMEVDLHESKQSRGNVKEREKRGFFSKLGM